jgi:hypothetical protein
MIGLIGDESGVHEKDEMAGVIGSSGTISGGLSEVKVVALTRKTGGDYSKNSKKSLN